MAADGRLPLEALFVLGYLALLAGLLLRREQFLSRALPLAIYFVLQIGWALALYAGSISPDLAASLTVAEYIAALAPMVLLGATLAFARSERSAELWLLVPTAFAIALLGLDARVGGPRNIELNMGGRVFTENDLRLAAGTLAWASALGLAIGFTGRARMSTSSPLHRNRLLYWIGALLLITTGTAVTLTRPDWSPLIGGAVTMLGSLATVIATRVYYLPDMRVMLRQVIGYTVITLVTFAIYLLGILIAQLTIRVQTGLEPLFGAVLVAGVLAVGYAPLRQGVRWLTERTLGGAAVDYTASLQDYSQRITQVLDLEPLAAIVLETVNSALGVSHGALFLAQDDPDSGLMLRAIGGSGIGASETLECPPTSPITERWRAGKPLLQYDVDVLPAYRFVSEAERAVLARWRMELFLPIRTMGQLIGVLALGSKRSRDPYFESDIAYLTALADQTGVALQNAKLFSDLLGANKQMADLNRSLERANEQLKELDKLKSAFIGVITHELRSPFAALDFSMQLIQKYGLDNLLPEQREQLQQLAEGLKRAQVMIDNLITFAAFLSRQGQLRITPVDLVQLAQETIKTLEPMAQTRQVKMTLEVSGPLPAIYGDPDRLADAIYHLTHNAIKFNRQGGSVILSCRAAPEDVILEVTDTGVGIAPEKLPEIWQDFTQLADPLRRGVEGLGLGLPLVKYVIKAHGGQVWARSQPGQGSTFGFRIPMAGMNP